MDIIPFENPNKGKFDQPISFFDIKEKFGETEQYLIYSYAFQDGNIYLAHNSCYTDCNIETCFDDPKIPYDIFRLSFSNFDYDDVGNLVIYVSYNATFLANPYEKFYSFKIFPSQNSPSYILILCMTFDDFDDAEDID